MGSQITGTAQLVRFMLRRDRVKLISWSAGFGLFVAYLVAALPSIAETDEELAAATQLYSDGIGRMLTGPGFGFDAPSYERFVANGYGLYFLVLAALMSILLVTRHTRTEEQTERAELVRANFVGRNAGLTAALCVALISNLTVSAVVFLAMIAMGGFAALGSAIFAASIAATGMVFAGLTSVTAQLSSFSRISNGLGGGLLGLAFIIRAGGDMAAVGGSSLSWFSPLAWGQQTAPFVYDRWWPLVLSVTLTAGAIAAGFFLANRRDLGASFVAARPGPAHGAPSLGTPFGLAARLQRGSIRGWAAALIASGFIFGAYVDSLVENIANLPPAFFELFGADDVLAGYLALMTEFMAFGVTVFAVLSIQALRTEETTGRAETVLATPVSRTRWLGSHLSVTALSVIGMMLLTGVALGLGASVVTRDGRYVWDMVLSHLNLVPSALLVLGLAALLFGIVPRALAAVWGLVGYSFFIGIFGQMLGLPGWLAWFSPFAHPAALPVEHFTVLPHVLLYLFTAAVTVGGLWGLRRREINRV